ncbi:MAG TPA: thioredoxin domain-containing protein [Anaerolineae bacterium]|nr:thioredoxin domain-containing protein [Anaerolineae bacterium]
MLSTSRLGLLLSVVTTLLLLSACTLFDLWGQPSAPIRVQPTPRPAVPVPDHVLGEANASITVEEYVDFQCPVCGSFARGTLQEIREKYVKSGQVKLKLHHFAFIGDESTRAAEASECANDQGKFWEYADLLFANQAGENQGAFADAKLISFAQQLDLQTEPFKSCLDNHQHLAEVQSSTEVGAARGINSVPTLFINGQIVRGAISLEQFEQHLTSISK